MKLSKVQIAYMFFAVIGAAGTLIFLIQYFQINGLNFAPIFSGPFANESSIFVTFELTVVFLVYLCWMLKEARELKMKNYWIYILLCFPSPTVSFPLFLFMRERKLQQFKLSGNRDT